MAPIEKPLLQAIDAANRAACVRLLEPLDEKARRLLQPAVATRAAELDAELSEHFDSRRRQILNRYEVARLALLGTASLTELKKASPWPLPESDAVQVLASRRPAWVADWADAELTKRTWSWPLVRALVRGKLIPKPATEAYALGLIAAPKNSPRELLKNDPPLLEDELWRLFENEGSGDLSLAAYDKYAPESHSWQKAFCSLAAEGAIDRARLLECSLDALARDFAPFRAGWFSRLHEALEPSEAERARLCQRYLDLLTSRVPATVSFAMKAVGELDKAGVFSIDRAIDYLGPALEARDKGTAQRALALLSKAVKRDSGLRPRVAEMAARALGHESADIQLAALALVEPNRALVAPYLDVLAPSVRAKLGAAVPAPAPTSTAAAAAAAPVSRVTPVDTESELVELFAAVLENQGPPMEIERVLEGVARIPASERLAASLAKRAAKLKASRDQRLRTALAELALAWTRRERTPQPGPESNLADFLFWRVWNLAEQVAQGAARPLLSLPTWPDGRIDPAELERRLKALSKRDREDAANNRDSLSHLDFLLAWLRAGAGVEEAAKLPQPRVTWTRRTWEVQGQTYAHYEPALAISNQRKASRFDPLSLATARPIQSPEMLRWCATVCPVWREGWYAAGCRAIGDNLNWDSALWANRAYLEPLASDFQTTPLGPMGALLIALALAAKEPGEAMLGVDCVIAAVAGGRLDGDSLGAALIEAASSGAIKFSRWAKQLAKASQAGPAHAASVFAAMERLFESGKGAEAADYGRLVDLAYELAHLTGLRLSRPGAVAVLAGIKTGGKTRKALAGLLAQKSGTPAKPAKP